MKNNKDIIDIKDYITTIDDNIENINKNIIILVFLMSICIVFSIVMIFFINDIKYSIDNKQYINNEQHINIPSKEYINSFCKDNGYKYGWLDSIECNTNEVKCYKSFGEAQYYKCLNINKVIKQ